MSAKAPPSKKTNGQPRRLPFDTSRATEHHQTRPHVEPAPSPSLLQNEIKQQGKEKTRNPAPRPRNRPKPQGGAQPATRVPSVTNHNKRPTGAQPPRAAVPRASHQAAARVSTRIGDRGEREKPSDHLSRGQSFRGDLILDACQPRGMRARRRTLAGFLKPASANPWRGVPGP